MHWPSSIFARKPNVHLQRWFFFVVEGNGDRVMVVSISFCAVPLSRWWFLKTHWHSVWFWTWRDSYNRALTGNWNRRRIKRNKKWNENNIWLFKDFNWRKNLHAMQMRSRKNIYESWDGDKVTIGAWACNTLVAYETHKISPVQKPINHLFSVLLSLSQHCISLRSTYLISKKWQFPTLIFRCH